MDSLSFMNMLDPYILDGNGEPVIERDAVKWMMWMGSALENGGIGVISQEIGDVRVSTVFLGFNHRFLSEGPPLLWETMVFGGSLEIYQALERCQDRCSGSREQALGMHNKMVGRVKLAIAEANEKQKTQISRATDWSQGRPRL